MPVTTYTTARIAALQALPAPTKPEKKELKVLSGLAKKLAKPSFTLKQDFAELKAAGAAFESLGPAAVPMQASLDECFVRAGLSLSERTELAGDYLAAFVDAKHKSAVQKSLAAVATARAAAASAATRGKRAGALAKADAAATSTLKKADKLLVADQIQPPPARYRSGDEILGSRGGRVAVLRDSGSPVAGASLLVPSGQFQGSLRITLEAASSFVTGGDVAAGPALAVGPDGTVFPSAATLSMPFQLPADTSATDLALLAKGPPLATISPVTPRSDGTLTAGVTTLTTFQAAIPAPPPGQPRGAYHMQMFVLNTLLDQGDVEVPPADLAGVLAGFEDRTITFRANHTVSLSNPVFPAFGRTFTAAAPHHADTVETPLDGSVDTTWTSGGTGRFALRFSIAGRTVDAAGVASDDARVIAFSGGGSGFEFLAVGVRGDTDAVTADLAGRWAAVEMGVHLLGDGAEPFTTRRFDAARTFTANGTGQVAFDAAGSRLETDVTYGTGEAEALHTRAGNEFSDSGAETWTLNSFGRITNSLGTRSGWFDGDSGILVTSTYEEATRRVSILVAVRQPATATPAAIPGLYRFAELDTGTTVDSPATTSSAHDGTPSIGSLDVASETAAELAFDAASRSVYTLTGTPAFPSITWMLTSSSTALAASSAPVVLALDAAGNHREIADERWFSFSGDGKYVLGVTRGEPARLARGILVGMK